MDEHFLKDLRKLLEDGIENLDWNCVDEAIDMIAESQGEYDDEFADYDE